MENIDLEIEKFANKKQARNLQRFFKTGKGEYGEGDIFLGLTMGENRLLSKKYNGLDRKDIQKLLDSQIHEKRMIALLILIEQYRGVNEKEKKEIFRFYISNTKNINNWDLVDVTCHKIVGDFLLNRNRDLLYQFVESDDLWERRIAIISCAAFIRNNDFKDCLRISKILLKDKHDLIHKAVGWMLREVGKRDEAVLNNFLKENYKNMPRTMLRYSIERFEEGKRLEWLRGKI